MMSGGPTEGCCEGRRSGWFHLDVLFGSHLEKNNAYIV
jgi:hypothetical protein